MFTPQPMTIRLQFYEKQEHTKIKIEKIQRHLSSARACFSFISILNHCEIQYNIANKTNNKNRHTFCPTAFGHHRCTSYCSFKEIVMKLKFLDKNKNVDVVFRAFISHFISVKNYSYIFIINIFIICSSSRYSIVLSVYYIHCSCC